MKSAAVLDSSSNQLIRDLSPSDKRMIAPGCERIAVRRGQKIMDSSDPLDGLYFPETTLLSIAHGGCGGEVAVIGREGFAGWSFLLGGTHTRFSAHACTRNGTLLRISLEAAQTAVTRSAAFRAALLPYVDVLTAQIADNGQSHAGDRLTVRIARWIKMRHDRIPGDEILVHHAQIAECLTIRRASVTDALHRFEGDAILRCRRGRIIVRDASRLSGLAAPTKADLLAPTAAAGVA